MSSSRNGPRSQQSLNVPLTIEEREKLAAVADSMGLTLASLIRGLAIGAITMGGATLDRLLAVGSKNTLVQSRHIDWTKMFEAKDDPDGYPLRLYTPDSTWFIAKQAPSGRSRGADDPSMWWHLRRKYTGINMPLAWTLKDACNLAHDHIEKMNQDLLNF